jgi:putative DNA primase/helicase
MRDRFIIPASTQGMLDELKDLTAPTRAFVRAYCVTGPDESCRKDDLYAAWRQWCQDNGRRESGPKASFCAELYEALPEINSSRPRNGIDCDNIFTGIALTPDAAKRVEERNGMIR